MEEGQNFFRAIIFSIKLPMIKFANWLGTTVFTAPTSVMKEEATAIWELG